MSTQPPRALLELAIESLMRNEVLAIEAVEYLPGELFPRVFMEAFIRGHTEVLKAMVLSWPFPSLPLGALMSIREPETLEPKEDVVRVNKMMLQTVLDGLDVLLNQKVSSSRMKLQVLDMRIIHQNFWRVWAGNELEACSSKAMRRTRREKTGTRETNKILSVLLDLWLSQEYQCPVASYLIKWVQERKDLVQLECKKLCITTMCFPLYIELLEMLNLDFVQELDLGYCWSLFILSDFAPFLGQMQNLHKITLSGISEPAFIALEKKKLLITRITSQFLKFHCLKEIHMDCVSFLEGHLDQVLRCLVSPLETLSVTHWQFSHSDWNHLSCSEQIRQLKQLDLSCINLSDFSPEPLRILLDNVSATLTTLYLENCRITDAQVCAFLPSLSSCSQLTAFCFVRNFMSVDTMKNLLSHTARLSNLALELYSPPREVHVPRNAPEKHTSTSFLAQIAQKFR
ncbi:PRAME family member 27-like [Octodon degus]|uniref:PRAME family member 27-like n=1 Tax=Octodon degus TaxID=10160 RepID=A0A6P3FVR1_OCTDE|nr:PRAME family member 27-like [Octodon degus]